MGIIGKWKVAEANVFDKSFNRTWRRTEDVLADENVSPMQKGMARTVYVFGEDGRALTLLPKGLAPADEVAGYDDDYDLGHEAQWKEEDGRFYISTEENGSTEWNELVPDGDGWIVLGMHRIEKNRGGCMDITGKWRIAEAKVFNAQTLRLDWRTAVDIMADDTIDDYVKESLGYTYLFTEDGKALLIIPVPENIPKEELDEALASGEVSLYDENSMILEEKEWKEEDGKLLFDSGAKGEVLGEKVSPWVEIKETENGIELMTFRLVKE